MEENVIPRDEFSVTLRGLAAHPGAVVKQSVVELSDFYGNLVSWILKTIRVDGNDTVFLQRQTADGSVRMVLPPGGTSALNRHRDGASSVNRRRGARQAVATRAAKGIKSTFGKK